MYITPGEQIKQELDNNELTNEEQIEISGLKNYELKRLMLNELGNNDLETVRKLALITSKNSEEWMKIFTIYRIDLRTGYQLNVLLLLMFVQVIIMALVRQKVEGISELKAFLYNLPMFGCLGVVYWLKEKKFKTKVYRKIKKLMGGGKYG